MDILVLRKIRKLRMVCIIVVMKKSGCEGLVESRIKGGLGDV